ncbi:MAG: hypothetical protein Q4C00_01530, partial [Bacillota bacterium]|nr:hypothetical protein [Bacillota bacterium]
MAADGSLTFDTKLDTDSFKKAMNNLSSTVSNGMKSVATKFSSGFSTLASHVKSFASTAAKTIAGFTAAAGAALTGAGGYAINLASDLTEVQNVVDVTFGENADQINQWAKSAATAFGLSELQAKQYTGTLGAMMKSMGLTDTEILTMSKDMVGLAGDFASFYNLDPEEAFEKIRSGISGETEPLKQLGINMSVANLEAYALSQGIDKSYESMTQAEQATLRYNYLMSVSADAQGDFTRTNDSLANQMRIAKLEIQDMAATLGTKLMPTAQEAFGVLTAELANLKAALNDGGVGAFFEQFGTSVSNIIAYIAEKTPDFINIGTDMIQSLIQGFINNYDRLSASMQQIVTSLLRGYAAVLPMALQLGSMIIGDIANGIISWLPNLGGTLTTMITTISNWLINNGPTLINIGMQVLTGIINGITEALPTLFEYMPIVLSTLCTALMDNLFLIFNAAFELIKTLGQGIAEALPKLIPAAVQIVLNLVEYLIDNIDTIIAVGLDIIIALIEGIILALPVIAERLPVIITKIVEALTNGLSKIEQQGGEIISKLIEGILKAVPILIRSLPQVVRAVINLWAGLYDAMIVIGKNMIIGLWNGICALAG